MTKRYTLSEYYELENTAYELQKEIFQLRMNIMNGDYSLENRKRLQLLEKELEIVVPQIARDIESGEIDYGTHLTRIK